MKNAWNIFPHFPINFSWHFHPPLPNRNHNFLSAAVSYDCHVTLLTSFPRLALFFFFMCYNLKWTLRQKFSFLLFVWKSDFPLLPLWFRQSITFISLTIRCIVINLLNFIGWWKWSMERALKGSKNLTFRIDEWDRKWHQSKWKSLFDFLIAWNLSFVNFIASHLMPLFNINHNCGDFLMKFINYC